MPTGLHHVMLRVTDLEGSGQGSGVFRECPHLS
jgi:hypothetical protein